ncbi:MAG: type I-C CRISPR-associated endonuclease Cas1 [Calditrichaeota bacterium]|nr:type I-C CRISPR-associated endonuclease Cas1 [Calditrichota bacterium]
MEVALNTLFITTEPAYLKLDHDTVVVEREEEPTKTLPLLAFSSIVLCGRITLSYALIARCAADGRTITFLDSNGRFRARVEGPVSGNVLLRQAQYIALGNEAKTTALARNFVAGKIENTRRNIMRAARESGDAASEEALRATGSRLRVSLDRLRTASDIAVVRGIEGEAAHLWFGVFNHMLLADRDCFSIAGRSRRPPLDASNALLSFLYTLIVHDCRSALEGVGLDPQAGFLHTLRAGRVSLALDLAEEFRPILGDRLALTLINRKQVMPRDFIVRSGGAVQFTDEARKRVLLSYVERKRDVVGHPASGRKIPLGLVPHLQARLLARFIRGELEEYPPFVLA